MDNLKLRYLLECDSNCPKCGGWLVILKTGVSNQNPALGTMLASLCDCVRVVERGTRLVKEASA
jgi:hypothetical protein